MLVVYWGCLLFPNLLNMLLLSLLLLGVLQLTKSEDIIVHTQSGPVIGHRAYSYGKEYVRFPGIPFAEPPVGELRFKAPRPVKPWTEPIDGAFSVNACVQYYPHYYPWNGVFAIKGEDCLYLEIDTPKQEAEKNDKKAVMFWIHGGGFNSGVRYVYEGDQLAMHGDVIVVAVNYRLGIFGFLSTSTTDAPGNMGLLDILTALQWVNENIEAFGGDKNRITVFGQGAGSIISALLTMSPHAKGLFQRIILESGVPFTFLTSYAKNYILYRKTANAVGCSLINGISNLETGVDCLRRKDAEDLAKTVQSFTHSSLRTFLPISGDEFLRIDPLVKLKTNLFDAVDVLAGVVQDEGSIELVTAFPDLFGPFGEKDPKINKTLGRQLILELLDSAPFKELIARHYLSDVEKHDYDTIRERVYHAIGDYSVVCPTLYFLEHFSQKKVKTYMYYFFQRNNENRSPDFHYWMGVQRYTEIPFVFGAFANDFYLSYPNFVKTRNLSHQIIKMWTDFAKTGVPSPEWKEFSRKDPYIQNLYANTSYTDNSTLKEHLENCKFLRPYLLSL